VTSTVNKLTIRLVESGPQGAIGVVAMVVLIVLLVQYELARTMGGTFAADRRRAYRVAIGPLLVAFTIVVMARLGDVLHPS
jgi:hypothetical protein